jgi:hypothetical protein
MNLNILAKNQKGLFRKSLLNIWISVSKKRAEPKTTLPTMCSIAFNNI